MFLQANWAHCFLHLLSGSVQLSRDHGEGRVLAVPALDRGDKSLSTPEDSLPVSKLGTSLSRPCHTLPCRSSLIGLVLWHAQPYFCHQERSVRPVSALRKGENENVKMLRGSGEFSQILPKHKGVLYKTFTPNWFLLTSANTTCIFDVNSTIG